MDCLAAKHPRHSTTVVRTGSQIIGADAKYVARSVHWGSRYDLERIVSTHLFGIAPNRSGTTFLQAALATSRRTWNLVLEGARIPGYRGPVRPRTGVPATRSLWASEQRWMDRIRGGRYDWETTRKAWYFQSFSLDPRACVFYTKTPLHLLIVDALARHFDNARFLFMVRDPYAVCGSFLRTCADARRALEPAGRGIEEVVAHHAVNCLIRQRRNVETFGDRGTFFTYEAMCAEPVRVARQIRELAPEIDDLDLNQRLAVKGRIAVLENMNARQIEDLDARQMAAVNRVFEAHRDVIEHFGYALR